MNLSTTDILILAANIIVCVLTLLLRRLSGSVRKVRLGEIHSNENENIKNELHSYLNVAWFIPLAAIVIFSVYHFSVQSGYEAHLMEWFNLIVRWVHVVFGIAWIGASFYFIFLENSLNRTENLRDELAGNLWAIHGGGFYYVEKYKSAPPVLPKQLHWFKYEAYFTWLTGMLLLTLVYFMNAKAVMIDASVRDISSGTAIIVSIGALLTCWITYDLMCRSPLLQRKKLFAVIGFLIVVGISYFFSIMFSGRAAFMLTGALLGTIMAGNVFFCIIPSQKALVAATKANKPVNPELGKIAGLRSLHNNYITLPVIFVMISNHFPTTFGNKYNWLILAGLTLASVAVRHFINLYEKGIYAKWMIPFATVAITALMIVTAPKKYDPKSEPPVAFSQVQTIFQSRCITCHSVKPTDDVNKIAPNGIMFDTPEEIKKHADRILVRAVETKTMPQGNKTHITEEERNLLGIWIAQGAKVE